MLAIIFRSRAWLAPTEVLALLTRHELSVTRTLLLP